MIGSFALRRPDSTAEALDLLAAGATPYCGGTELVAAMRLGLLAPAELVDLKRIPGLSGIAGDGAAITVGATTRHRAIAADPLVAAHAPVLREACARLGNQRVRATGSIAGNLCFAEPRSDVATALLALGAAVTLGSVRGEREIALDEFVLGALDTARGEDELLLSVRVPVRPGPQVYLRFQPNEYPTTCVALIGGADGEPARVAVGALGERAHVCEVASVDELDPDAIAAAVDVTEDRNGAEDYKRHLCAVYLRRAIRAWKELACA